MTGSGEEPTRRNVLETVAAAGATGVVASLAGCQQIKNAVGLGSNRTKQVPEDAQGAVFVDVQAALGDEGVKAISNAVLNRLSEFESYDGPEDYDAAKERFEEETDLDPSKGKWQLYFTQYSDYGVSSGYYGTLFKGSWDEDAVVEAFESAYSNDYQDVSYDEEDYEGKTLYEPGKQYAPYVGVISGKKYVSGPQDAVEDAIDVAKGNGDKMAKKLRKAYGNTKNAPVRYVGEMASWVSGEVTGQEREFDLDTLQEVDGVAGSVYKNGDKRGTENTLRAEDKDAAEEVTELLEGYLAYVENGEEYPELVTTVADEATVERKGKKVVVSYEAPVDELAEMVEGSMPTPYATATATATAFSTPTPDD